MNCSFNPFACIDQALAIKSYRAVNIETAAPQMSSLTSPSEAHRLAVLGSWPEVHCILCYTRQGSRCAGRATQLTQV